MNIRINLALRRLAAAGLLASGTQMALAVNDTADNYDIAIAGTNTSAKVISGTGGFAGYDNPGTPTPAPPVGPAHTATATVIVNNVPVLLQPPFPPNTIFLEMTFGGPLDVMVEPVNFADTKTPQNQIVGNYVEGLRGTIPNTSSVLPIYGPGRFQLTFAFTGGGGNPSGFVKTCTILDTATGATVTTQCSYHAQNHVVTVPEPGTLALVPLGLALTVLVASRRRAPRRRV